MLFSPESADLWAREASRAPIAFSQVREDPLLDEAVVAGLPEGASAWMIASGGDTAAVLVAGGRLGRLHLQDFNPAQLALTKVKLHLLRHATPPKRMALLGHAPMDPEMRGELMTAILQAEDLAADILGEPAAVARLGADQAGRYEILFHHLRAHLEPCRDELEQLFTLDDPQEQAARVEARTRLGVAFDGAFDRVMRLENLVSLFGEEATRNSRMPFARHFATQTRRALAASPARANPFLAQLLLGRFVDGFAYEWLTRPSSERWPEITIACSPAIEALAAAAPESFDFVHLSNILDWLSPEAAAKTLEVAWRALRPGGVTFIRQLNSNLNIPAANERFAWRAEAEDLHRRDRSFFYRAHYLGSKPATA